MADRPPKGRHRWGEQIQGPGHCRHRLRQGLAVAPQDRQGGAIARRRGLLDRDRQSSQTGRHESGAHRPGLDRLRRADIGGVEIQGLPEPLAQGSIRLPAIGHLEREGQTVAADVEGGAGTIQQPAPAGAAVLPAMAIAPQGDRAGAADHDDSGSFGEGAAQGRALIPADPQPLRFQSQRLCGEGQTPALHGAVPLDAAGSHRRCQQDRPAGLGRHPGAGPLLPRRHRIARPRRHRARLRGDATTLEPPQGVTQAADQGLTEALLPSRRRQMAHAGALPLGQYPAAVLLGEPAGGVGLTGVEAGDQSGLGEPDRRGWRLKAGMARAGTRDRLSHQRRCPGAPRPHGGSPRCRSPRRPRWRG